jgi:hypothetical protein
MNKEFDAQSSPSILSIIGDGLVIVALPQCAKKTTLIEADLGTGSLSFVKT